MGAFGISARSIRKQSLAQQIEQFQNNQSTISSSHPIIIPMFADCCDNEKEDKIFLMKCGHVIHSTCLKRSLLDFEQTICFCGQSSGQNIQF